MTQSFDEVPISLLGPDRVIALLRAVMPSENAERVRFEAWLRDTMAECLLPATMCVVVFGGGVPLHVTKVAADNSPLVAIRVTPN
jgi:hypothetical protein